MFKLFRLTIVIGLLATCPSMAAAQQRLLPAGVYAGIAFENGEHDSVGPYKWRGFVELQNQFGRGERIKLDGTLSGEIRELQGITLVYDQPLGGNWKLHLNAGVNNTRPGGFISELFEQRTREFGGGGSALGSTISYTHRPSEKLVVIASAGFQSTDIRTEQTALLPGISDNSFRQRTRDLQASLAFNYNVSDDTGLFGALGIEQGVDWLDPEGTRENLDLTPTILRYSGSIKHNLPNRFQIVLRGTAQWTPDRVNRLKLFSLGGWDYATGYKPGESSGDVGAAARLELNQLNVVDLAGGGQLFYQPFVFVDGGITRDNDPVAGETSGVEDKASAGIGISFEATNGLHAGMQLSFPLSGPTIFDGRDEDARFLFSVGFKQ